MGVSFRRAATQNSSQVVERPPSPIQKPRTGREGGLCSGVTRMGLTWAEFRFQTAVQSIEAGLCGLLKETPMALQSDNFFQRAKLLQKMNFALDPGEEISSPG